MTINTHLDDSQWAAITAHLPRTIRGRASIKGEDYRAFVDAVLWVVKNDVCWKTVPCDGWRAIYVRFIRWADQGLWTCVEQGIEADEALVHALRKRVAQYSGKKQRRRHGRPEVALPAATAHPWTY